MRLKADLVNDLPIRKRFRMGFFGFNPSYRAESSYRSSAPLIGFSLLSDEVLLSELRSSRRAPLSRPTTAIFPRKRGPLSSVVKRCQGFVKVLSRKIRLNRLINSELGGALSRLSKKCPILIPLYKIFVHVILLSLYSNLRINF